MTDFSKYPCGATGLEFPNGLPQPGHTVRVKTVWSNDEWKTVVFQQTYAWERTYDWFSVYGRPNVDEGSLPIVLEWEEDE
jgi:hypothetical protein